jgi:hypothetical protein
MKTKVESIAPELVNEFKLAINRWARCGKSTDLAPVYKTDAKALRVVLSLLLEGRVSQAANKAQVLDTIVRDQIPNKLWDIMMEAI